MTGAHGLWMRRKNGAGYTVESMRARSVLDPSTGCWNWRMSLSSHGYGQARHKGVSYGAHALMFMLSNPDMDVAGRLVCHHCDNRRCINPEHLYAGSSVSNQPDRVERKPWSFSGGKKGEEHQDAKLTEDKVRAIRRSDEPSKALARVYEVNNKTIRDVRKRVTWKHVA